VRAHVGKGDEEGLASTKGPSFSITFKVALVPAGVVPDGVVGVRVDDVLGVGEVVELLHATTVNANTTPPRSAKRIYGSSEVCRCTTRARAPLHDKQP
jgi:hypothetical protein